MADVRSLLRNERASRRITHPHASYTSTGKLLCSVCAVQLKTESLWDKHIRSQEHNLAVQRASAQAPHGKKRKAGGEGSEDDGRKRVKGVPGDFFDQATTDDDEGKEEQQGPTEPQDIPIQDAPLAAPSDAAPAPAPEAEVDENEWAAFQRDIAAAPISAIYAEPTISAAPMSAEELAAQAREQQSTQRGRREAELEDEKEDAERALQEEFDEMESLEERLRRLREKREALRIPSDTHELQRGPDPVPEPVDVIVEDDDDDDEEDDFDDWGFGAR